MAVRIVPGYRQQLVSHLLTELAAAKQREESGIDIYQSDICDWSEHNFYIPFTAMPIVMPLHQKAVLRYFLTRRENGHFPYQTLVYSSIKKSGKSTVAGIIGRWFAETQGRYQEIYAIGNDLEQAKDRSYKEVTRSLELTPGYNYNKSVLPGRWALQKLSMRCLLTGSSIRAIAVDAKGEAGGQQSLTIWTELWGAENEEAKRFWDEMTPIPTVPDSIRLVETYAGYDGESDLLRGLYDIGMEGHQLTAGELAEFVCRPDRPGETFQDYVDCWHETKGDPDVLIPIWANNAAGLGMYWDTGMVSRRMPWQHMPLQDGEVVSQGTEGLCEDCHMPVAMHYISIPADRYYANEEALGPPQKYRRLHLNEWVGAESQFVPMESYDACGRIHAIPELQDSERTPMVCGVDAAVTGDCFGTVVVSRCPQDSNCVDVRALKKWDPVDSGGVIDLAQPEAFLRKACSINNIVQIAYDTNQMESMAQRLRKDGVAWVEPFNQMSERLKADSMLYDAIISQRIHFHHAAGCPGRPTENNQFPGGSMCHCWLAPLREHIANSNAKVQKDEDSRLRIVKKAAGKIDLAVALSMANSRCLYLRLA